jgi:hypothetical protein
MIPKFIGFWLSSKCPNPIGRRGYEAPPGIARPLFFTTERQERSLQKHQPRYIGPSLDFLPVPWDSLSYDVRDYAKLGTLHKLLHVNNPIEPTESEIVEVKQAIADAIADARMGAEDLGNRMNSPAARKTRKAGRTVRALMEKQWVTA